MIRIIYAIIYVFVFIGNVQSQTVGLINYNEASFEGYTLFNAPDNTTYLINNCGERIQSWVADADLVGEAELRTDGQLLRMINRSDNDGFFQTDGAATHLELVAIDGSVNWSYQFADSTKRIHHDMKSLPNGNILFLAYESRSELEAIAYGRDPATINDGELWMEQIVEVDPTRPVGMEIVWEWHFWDHLHQDFDDTKVGFSNRIDRDPLLLDINFYENLGDKDWIRFTSIDFFPMMNQIMISSKALGEIYILDHSTTTQQAASHFGGFSNRGGDLLYRWGNSASYRQGDSTNRKLWNQAEAHWVPVGFADEGKIMIFNGSPDVNSTTSSIEIITPPVDDYISGNYIFIPGGSFTPFDPDWKYNIPSTDNFFELKGSTAQRLENGNTLFIQGVIGKIFEITPDREIVWEYINPITTTGPISQGDMVPNTNGANENPIFRSTRYPDAYDGLADFDLNPNDPLELNFPMPYICQIISAVNNPEFVNAKIYPNPATEKVGIMFREYQNYQDLRLYNGQGKMVIQKNVDHPEVYFNVSTLNSGIYYLVVDGMFGGKVIIE